ncbi:MAG: excinuclease ABC subunit UvrC [Candidatus Latescibacteria bacterium]|nr:excinuclease ABC subunit UvrC [bacterium]MBD3425105.1 excinuclease ABC subunit UvrC [Candidatus Latescibacterota bacterium]
MRLLEKSSGIPELPGVYLMKDSGGRIIYVGKAKNLKKRVKSYFRPAGATDPKTEILREHIRDIDYVTTENEMEALVLECNFIRENRPAYNVKLKGGKKYPYLKLTTSTDFPRIMLVREVINDGSEYFGPYTDAAAVRRTLSLIGNIFRLRRCSQRKFDMHDSRECLYYQIGKCSAPCTGKITRKEYQRLVREVRLFLKGKTGRLTSELRRRMNRLSSRKEYEKAAVIRDQIRSIEKISEKQLAIDPGGSDEDIAAVAREKNSFCAVLMKVREGRILSSETFFLPSQGENDLNEVTGMFLQLYYHTATDIPGRIYVDRQPVDRELIQEWLSEKRGAGTRIMVPRRGRRKRMVELVRRNASVKLLDSRGRVVKETEILEKVKNRLNLPATPLKAEAYDISNISGMEAVGSMVSFRNGEPYRKGYRRFRIRISEGPDDFAMISEVISRRFRNLSDMPAPDLILIDGGKGQVSSAVSALEGREIFNLPVVGLAKKKEEVYIPSSREPLKLPAGSETLRFLQRMRDEAHRFAVEYHRKLRLKKISDSVLDDIPGIGEQRKVLLLLEFGSIDNIRKSSADEISSVPGIGRKLAMRVKFELEKNDED